MISYGSFIWQTIRNWHPSWNHKYGIVLTIWNVWYNLNLSVYNQTLHIIGLAYHFYSHLSSYGLKVRCPATQKWEKNVILFWTCPLIVDGCLWNIQCRYKHLFSSRPVPQTEGSLFEPTYIHSECTNKFSCIAWICSGKCGWQPEGSQVNSGHA